MGSDQREEPDPAAGERSLADPIRDIVREAREREQEDRAQHEVDGDAVRRPEPQRNEVAPKADPGVAAEARVLHDATGDGRVRALGERAGVVPELAADVRVGTDNDRIGGRPNVSADSAVDADRARAGVERAVDSARLRQLEGAGPELGVPADRAVDDHGSGGDLNVSVDAARFRDPDQAGRAGEVTLNGAVHDNRAGHALDAVNRLTLVDDDRPGRALDRLGCRESRRERREERDERERDGETTTTSGAT